MAGEDWIYETRPSIPTLRPKTQVRFRDLNAAYGIDREDIIITEELAVRGQMRNLLSTLRGSEWGEPDYGSDLPLRIYEPISSITAYMLETDTVGALTSWMSSVVTVGANVDIKPLSTEDGYLISIPYILNSTGRSSVYSFEALR